MNNLNNQSNIYRDELLKLLVENKDIDNTLVPIMPRGIVGLNNLGNTCYMNTILQCLFNIQELQKTFTDDKIPLYLIKTLINKNNNINPNNCSVVSTNIKKTITFRLMELVKLIWQGQQTCISPINFRQLFVEKNSSFQNLIHQDCHEALLCILDNMSEDFRCKIHNVTYNFCDKKYCDLFKQADEKKLSDKDCFELQKTYPNFMELYAVHKSLIQFTFNYYPLFPDFFQTLLCNSLSCPNCNYCTYTVEPHNILTIPIPTSRHVDMSIINEKLSHFPNLDIQRRNILARKFIFDESQKTIFTLNDCFDTLIKTEILDDENKWTCTICNNNVSANKQTLLWKIPKILIIHIKRFINIKNVGLIKLNNLIDFPKENLCISNYLSKLSQHLQKKTYNLVAIANHIGTLNAGHYYAFIKSYVNNNWYKIDDSSISLINESDIVTNNAYMLFYRSN